MHMIDLSQLEFVDQMLRHIMETVEEEFGPRVITSIYRIDDSGVHGTLPVRGIDVRCRNYNVGKAIETWVNTKWEYDLERPWKSVALAHGSGENFHIHFQSHPNTRCRK